MSASFSLLRQQVSSYSQYAVDESLMKAHREAMACRKLEATLQIGLGLYKGLQVLNDATDDIHSEVLDIASWWLNPCEQVESSIKWFEQHDYKVEGAMEFREVCKHARALIQILPTRWKGQKIIRGSELSSSDFPYPPEPE